MREPRATRHTRVERAERAPCSSQQPANQRWLLAALRMRSEAEPPQKRPRLAPCGGDRAGDSFFVQLTAEVDALVDATKAGGEASCRLAEEAAAAVEQAATRRPHWGNATVSTFGSSCTGLASVLSDADLSIQPFGDSAAAEPALEPKKRRQVSFQPTQPTHTFRVAIPWLTCTGRAGKLSRRQSSS